MFPISEQKLEIVVAKLKARHYRSTGNYLATYFEEAKLEARREQEPPPSAELIGYKKKLIASANRGLGPPQQAADLQLEKLSWQRNAIESRLPPFEGAPILPLHTILLSGAACAREVETSSMRRQDAQILDSGHSSLFFMKSKMDQKASGVHRQFQCRCGDWTSIEREIRGVDRKPLCPHCTLLSFLEKRDYMVGDHPLWPLFCDAKGREITKDAFAETMKFMCKKAGWEAPPGQAFTGHSCRVSGARFYYRDCNWRLPAIMFIGRWLSEKVVKRYIGEELLAEPHGMQLPFKTTVPIPYERKLRPPVPSFESAAPAAPTGPSVGASHGSKPLYDYYISNKHVRLHRAIVGESRTKCGRPAEGFIKIPEKDLAAHLKCMKCFKVSEAS